MNYYDMIIGAVPTVLIGVVGVLTYLGFSTAVAVPIGGALAIAIIAHALFASPVAREAFEREGTI